MTTNSMLSIIPDYEIATRYGAAWQKLVTNAAIDVGLDITELYGSNATGKKFFSVLETQDPILVNIFGHGNYNIIAGQDDEIYLIGCQTDGVLAGRIIYNLSCRSGRDLADSAISKGAIAFLGYNEDFIFIITEGNHPDGGMNDPLADEASRGFFESHNSAPISYLKGATIPNSYWESQNTFNYWIEVWEEIDSQVASLLVWDRDHQVMKPDIGPRPTPAKLGPLLLMFTPLLIIPILKRFK